MAGLPQIEAYDLPSSRALPKNTVGWEVEATRAVLLIHDMQGYFLQPLPAALRDALVQNVAALRERCAARGVPVAYTTQPGRMTDEERGLLRDFWGPGMRTTAADREVVGPLAPGAGDWVFTKWRYSAFFRTDLGARMRESGRDQLVVCGVYAHLGVLVSAIDAFSHDIQPFLVADGVADFSAAHHQQALAYTALRCGKVVVSGEVVA